MINFMLRLFCVKECQHEPNEIGINVWICKPKKKVVDKALE